MRITNFGGNVHILYNISRKLKMTFDMTGNSEEQCKQKEISK